MVTYYLDIETTGIEPSTNNIITIQYAQLERGTGKLVDDLTILKAWEDSEQGIVDKFIKNTNVCDDYPFGFMPVGYNLQFEHRFLLHKSKKYGLGPIQVMDKAFIDLRVVGLLMNRGEFKDSGLDKITGKPQSGRMIPNWYHSGDYDSIEQYVRTELVEFVKWYEWLLRRMPELREEWNEVIGI